MILYMFHFQRFLHSVRVVLSTQYTKVGLSYDKLLKMYSPLVKIHDTNINVSSSP